jgi:hypothetical protein
MQDVYWQVVVGAVVTIFSVLFGIIAKKVIEVPKIVAAALKENSDMLERRFNRIDMESKKAHRRLHVHDRLSSKLIGVDFDSAAVADSGIYPVVKEHR